jgi:succinate dehydrogenase/fumarate reductase flavoprotein subunit
VDYDVIILGGGGAGLAAAVEASSAGAAVLLLEAADELGGSTRMSAGVFYAAETSVQRVAGVADSVEAMYAYYMALNQWFVEPALAMLLCRESGPTLEWLIKLGMDGQRFMAENAPYAVAGDLVQAQRESRCFAILDEASGHVYDEAGAVIPGLFAAGEAAGGVMGPRYVGGGNSISNAIVFGRLAGATAAGTAR